VTTATLCGVPPIVDFNGMGCAVQGGAHQATFRVNLVYAGERDRSSTEVSAIHDEVARIPRMPMVR
jgi:hypothetical protein